MPYTEIDSDEAGNVLQSRTFTDDGNLTIRDAADKIVYQGPVPEGVVKAVGEYNMEVGVGANRGRLNGLRSQIAGNTAPVNLGLNIGAITLTNQRIDQLRDAVLTIIDIMRDSDQ